MPTEEEFIAAFLTCGKKMAVRGKLLDAHLRFPLQGGLHTATTTQLAKAVGYPNHNTVNLQYGLLARDVCEALGVEPDDVEEDSNCWLSIFVEFDPNGLNAYGHWELKLRPEVAAAWQRFKAKG